jgi:uncharacterized protein (TIGR03435 family)
MTPMRVTVICALLLGPALLAQQTRPAFDVASIKRHTSDTGGMQIQILPGGSFVADNVSLVEIIRFAYGLRDFETEGAPGWAQRDRFDFAAKAGKDAAYEEMRQMLRTLLEDRCRLVARIEQRQMPGFELVRDRPDGKLGPNLLQVSSQDECRDVQTKRFPVEIPNAMPARGCVPASLIARMASQQLRSSVADRTGLTGLWMYALYYTPGIAVDPTQVGFSADAPSYSTALKEQLGLRLEQVRAVPVDVLVIESLQPPTEN